MKARLFACAAAACLMLAGAGAAWAESDIVVVVNKSLPIQELDARAIKLAYFGIPQTKGGIDLQPIINTGDDDVTRRFLDAALGLKPDEYRDNLRHRQFAQGGRSLREVADTAELLRLLARLPGAVTYMRADQVAQYPDLKVVSTLH